MTAVTGTRQLVGEITTVLRFVVVGAVTMVVYVGTYTLLGVVTADLVAFSLAYAAATAFHYLSNRLFTFRHVEPRSSRTTELLRYSVVVAVGYVVNLAIYHLTTVILGFPAQFGLALGVLVNTGATFILSRFWVFK